MKIYEEYEGDEAEEKAVDQAPAGQPTKLPWAATPCAADHGDSTCIGRKDGEFTVCRIDSACWDPKASIKYAEDRENMQLILRSVNGYREALATLREMDEYLDLKLLGWRKQYPKDHTVVFTAERKQKRIQKAIALLTKKYRT